MSEPIPFHKALIEEEDVQAVADAVRSGWLTMGPGVLSFEEAFKARVDTSYGLAVNSCTAALHLSLDAIGLQAGDEVLVPAMTFAATAEVVCYFGAKPVFIDIQATTQCMDPDLLETALTSKTKAIIPVHYAGQPADMDEIIAFADKHGLKVIEDAAHALPATYKGRDIGSIGDLTAFSFYATKTLVTGEGGMVTTNRQEYADRIKIMRLHGMSKDAWKRNTSQGSWFYEVVAPGFKYNMTDPAAAMGRVQLAKLDRMADMRRKIDRAYRAQLDCHFIDFLEAKTDRTSAAHLFVIKLKPSCALDRNQLIEKLAGLGIMTSVHFIPLPLQPAYKPFVGAAQTFPVALGAYERMLSLPIWPGMTEGMVERVAQTINELVKGD